VGGEGEFKTLLHQKQVSLKGETGQLFRGHYRGGRTFRKILFLVKFTWTMWRKRILKNMYGFIY